MTLFPVSGLAFLTCLSLHSFSPTGDCTAQDKVRQRAHLQFDGDRAYRYLIRQTEFGPRGPGLPGHGRCLRYLKAELAKLADSVTSQEFFTTLSSGTQVTLTNLIAAFNPRSPKRILLSAHWDTRLWADKDPDQANHAKPIIGANDGASGVAVLLEIARQLKEHAPPVGVDIVLFDGEDLGTSGVPESFSLGSRHFATTKSPSYQPMFGINIDMIGDRELRIYREQNSERMAPEVQALVFSAARELGISQFLHSTGPEVSDDHLPLNRAGIPTINLIDFDYPDESNRYWHTTADTADKCSPESLQAVGTVILYVLRKQS